MDLTSLSTDGAAKEEPLSGVLRNMGTSAFIFGEHGNKSIYFRGTWGFLLHFWEQGNTGFKSYYKIMHFHMFSVCLVFKVK